jgi:5-methylcytosine-specific restriction enzyme A
MLAEIVLYFKGERVYGEINLREKLMLRPYNKAVVRPPENRLYDNVRWRKCRSLFLSQHPLCQLCAQQGRDTPASIVDHKTPHHDDPLLFWDHTNWQALCPSCHSGTKRIAEAHGYSQAAAVDGQPTDPLHPWNRSRP